MKEEFKKIIDEMPDEEFLDFSFALLEFVGDFDADWIEDEGWEDEAEKFYNNEKNNISNFPTENNDLLFYFCGNHFVVLIFYHYYTDIFVFCQM